MGSAILNYATFLGKNDQLLEFLAHFFGPVHCEKWAGPNKNGQPAQFSVLPIFDMNALSEKKIKKSGVPIYDFLRPNL